MVAVIVPKVKMTSLKGRRTTHTGSTTNPLPPPLELQVVNQRECHACARLTGQRRGEAHPNCARWFHTTEPLPRGILRSEREV